MVKKIKKKKKRSKEDKGTEGPDTVPVKDYNMLKKKYIRLKKEYRDLKEAFDRISVLEEDINKVHQKLDSMDTDSDSVRKEILAVRSRVDHMQRNVEKMSVLATKVSAQYVAKKKGGLRPRPPTNAPMRPKPRATKALTRAAKALSQVKTAKGGSTVPRPVKKKATSDEISVQPDREGPVPKSKDLKDHADRMDGTDVITDEDMDSLDYLVREEGKKVPLEKKTVDKEIEEGGGEE